MSDPVTTARAARESLSRGLNALQSDANLPPALAQLAAPIAQAMGALHQIERSNGTQLVPHASVALDNVRKALASLQAQPSSHAALAAAMEAVASSLGQVHALSKLADAPPQHAAPPHHAPAAPAQHAPPPQHAPHQPAPAQHHAPQPAPAPQHFVPAPPPPGAFAPQAQQAPPPQAYGGAPAAHMPHPQQGAPYGSHGSGSQPAFSGGGFPPPAAAAPAYAPPAPSPATQRIPPPAAAPYANAPQVARDPFAAPPQQVHGGFPGQPQQSAPYAQQQPPQANRGAAGDAAVVSADLGAQSATNFYKGLSGNDIIDHGGLFVSTYMIPKIGTTVRLKVSLPGGYEFEAGAVVRWRREPSDGSDAPPGFGAQFTQITGEARQLVYRYVRNREPLFHDDL